MNPATDTLLKIQPEETAGLAVETTGVALLPGDPVFEAGTATWSQALSHHPDVAGVTRSSADTEALARFAAPPGLLVPVLTPGRDAVALADGDFLITARLSTEVRADARTRSVRTGAGTRRQPVIDEAASLGLAPVAGSSPTDGAAPHTPDSGLSPALGRSYGYAAEHARDRGDRRQPGNPVSSAVIDRSVTFRLARAEDLDAVNELHSRCTPESLRARYGVSRDRLRDREWRGLCEAPRGQTLFAQLADRPDHVIAFASLVRTTRPRVGEASVLVADDWQGMGLGTLLAQHLVHIARQRSDEGVEASTALDNIHALKILRRLNVDLRYPAPRTVWGWLPLSSPSRTGPSPALLT